METQLKTYLQREKLQPLCELEADDRDYLFKNSAVKSLPPRTLVTADEQVITYLLEGQVSLLSSGFVVDCFSHTDLRGLLPLLDASKGEDAALFTSHGVTLEISAHLFAGLYAQQKGMRGAIDSHQLECQEQQLLDALEQRLQQGQLVLPTLPEAASKVREAINHTDVGSAEIIQIVQTDPVLSARLVQVANSPLYGGWRKVKSVQDAVRRLGLEATRSLSLSLCLNQLFDAQSALVKREVRQLYAESTQVAALAYVVARNRAHHLDPEQALLVGLLHKLGNLPILQYVDQNPRLISTPKVLSKSLKKLNMPIITLLSEQWRIDAQLLMAIDLAESYDRDTGQRVDYSDIMIAAKLLYLQQSGQLDDVMSIDQFAITTKLQLLAGAEDGVDFVVQAKHEIEDVQRALMQNCSTEVG